MQNLRSFSLVATVDHGRTILSDGLVERTGALTRRELTE